MLGGERRESHFIMTSRIKRTAATCLDDREDSMKTNKTVVWGSRSGAVASNGTCSTAASNALGCALCVASYVMTLQIDRSIRHLFVTNGWSIQITAGVSSRAPATCLCYPLSLESFSEL